MRWRLYGVEVTVSTLLLPYSSSEHHHHHHHIHHQQPHNVYDDCLQHQQNIARITLIVLFQVWFLVKFPQAVNQLTTLPITHLVLGVDEDICSALTPAEMYLSSAIL